MPHVCILTSVHPPFDGRIFHRQGMTLVQAGHKVTLVAPADFKRQEMDGVTILGVSRPNSRIKRPLAWWRLFRQARYLRPDIIHFHDPELLLLAPLLRRVRGRRVRLVYDVHEYFVDQVATKYWIPPRLRPLVACVVKQLERLLVRWVDGIVCAVDEQKPLYNGFRGPVAAARNLPLARLFEGPEAHPALNVDGFKLIYVGLILPQRGIGVLLEAMRTLRERGVEDVYLFLVGPDTSTAYIRQVQAFAESHRITNQVRWLGYVPHHQLKDYLANADVGTAPGLRTRQYSKPGIATKLFEYMLCGLPVLSVDHPHRRIYIEEGNCGLVVPSEDASAYAEAILWLRDHPEEARAMGERGRAMVLDHYTWEREQARLLAFYQELLA